MNRNLPNLRAGLAAVLARRRALWPVAAACLCLAMSSWPGRAQEQTLALVSSFTTTGPIVYSPWPADVRANAALYSARTNVWDAEAGRMVYSVALATNFPWQWTSGASTLVADAIPVVILPGWDYLPPEADEVQLRIKVTSGQFRLSLGCINLAFAPGDAFTDIRVVDESVSGWQTIRFSLHKHLIRNYRRSDFTKSLPYVSLTRWIQEPLRLHVFRPGHGELLLDSVALVGSGLGRAYPEPAGGAVTHVATVADFETTNDPASVFTFSTVGLNLLGPQPTNYAKPSAYVAGTIMVAGKTIQWFLPPRFSRIEESLNGVGSLEVKQTGYESFAFTGLRLPRVEGANALLMTVRADHESAFTNVVVDFVAHAAPPASAAAFPWTKCQAPAAWLADPNLNFDLFLSETNTWQESYALYHLRRSVPNHQWTRLLLPLDDFAGLYACNEGTNILQDFQPLRSASLLCLSFFSPYRQLRAETRLCVDDLALVRVDLPTEQLHSFWQNPAIANARLIALPDYRNYYGSVRERDQPLGPLSLSVLPGAQDLALPVAGPADQRYDLEASDDLLEWQPVATGYVNASADPLRVPRNRAARFFRAVSE